VASCTRETPKRGGTRQSPISSSRFWSRQAAVGLRDKSSPRAVSADEVPSVCALRHASSPRSPRSTGDHELRPFPQPTATSPSVRWEGSSSKITETGLRIPSPRSKHILRSLRGMGRRFEVECYTRSHLSAGAFRDRASSSRRSLSKSVFGNPWRDRAPSRRRPPHESDSRRPVRERFPLVGTWCGSNRCVFAGHPLPPWGGNVRVGPRGFSVDRAWTAGDGRTPSRYGWSVRSSRGFGLRDRVTPARPAR